MAEEFKFEYFKPNQRAIVYQGYKYNMFYMNIAQTPQSDSDAGLQICYLNVFWR